MNIALGQKFLLFMAVVVLPGAAFAGAPKLKPRQPYKPTYDVIKAVDPTAQTVTIGHVNSTDTSTKTFKLDKFSEIEVNGATGTLNDVKTGMKVSVTTGADDNTASRLVVSPAPTPAPSEPGH
jgi:hypothetical protein